MRIHAFQRSVEAGALWSGDETAQAAELLKRDPLYRRITPDDVPALISGAIELGRARCDDAIERAGTADPLPAAQHHGVKVLFDISETGSIPFTVLSEYSPKPPVITVRENAVRSCAQKLEKHFTHDAKRLSAGLANVCIAHELYHHIERRDMSYVNFGYKIKVIDLRFLKIEKSLTALSEIAAHSFAKRMLGLPFLPCVLHPLLFDEAQP